MNQTLCKFRTRQLISAHFGLRLRSGLTLVELLVVVAIVSILVALILPAVQAARESSRVATCQGHLRQIGLAMNSFESAQRRFPSGGWGYRWVGFSDIGVDVEQPGAWTFSLLPYIEQSEIYQNNVYNTTALRRDANLRSILVAKVRIYNCPSRRDSSPIELTCITCQNPVGLLDGLNHATRSDYAVNAGDGEPDVEDMMFWPLRFSGPSSLVLAQELTKSRRWPNAPKDWSGISFLRKSVNIALIEDGTSNTILVGEKHVSILAYRSGLDVGDNEPMFSGFNNDNHRSTNPKWPFKRDGAQFSVGSFGSAHATSNFVFCDGSIHSIDYKIDPMVFRNFGSRHDGQNSMIPE